MINLRSLFCCHKL